MSLLQMSVAGAVMIMVITVIRALAINRLPKKTFLILWGITIIRLLIPFSCPSKFSIYSLLGKKTVSDINETPAVRFMPINTQGPVSTQAPQSQIPALTISAWDIIWVAGLVLCAVFLSRHISDATGNFRHHYQLKMHLHADGWRLTI